MKGVLITIFMVLIFSSMIPGVAESIEAEKQAIEIARTGLIHGQISIQSITDMVRYLEQAMNINDGSTQLKEYADNSLGHARKALTHLKEAIRYAEQISNIKVEKKE